MSESLMGRYLSTQNPAYPSLDGQISHSTSKSRCCVMFALMDRHDNASLDGQTYPSLEGQTYPSLDGLTSYRTRRGARSSLRHNIAALSLSLFLSLSLSLSLSGGHTAPSHQTRIETRDRPE